MIRTLIQVQYPVHLSYAQARADATGDRNSGWRCRRRCRAPLLACWHLPLDEIQAHNTAHGEIFIALARFAGCLAGRRGPGSGGLKSPTRRASAGGGGEVPVYLIVASCMCSQNSRSKKRVQRSVGGRRERGEHRHSPMTKCSISTNKTIRHLQLPAGSFQDRTPRTPTLQGLQQYSGMISLYMPPFQTSWP